LRKKKTLPPRLKRRGYGATSAFEEARKHSPPRETTPLKARKEGGGRKMSTMFGKGRVVLHAPKSSLTLFVEKQWPILKRGEEKEGHAPLKYGIGKYDPYL